MSKKIEFYKPVKLTCSDYAGTYWSYGFFSYKYSKRGNLENNVAFCLATNGEPELKDWQNKEDWKYLDPETINEEFKSNIEKRKNKCRRHVIKRFRGLFEEEVKEMGK